MRAGVRVSFVALLTAVAVPGGGELPGSSAEAAAKRSCRAAAGLNNNLALGSARKIATKRVTCAVAKAVPRSFANRCLAAYTSQGACRLTTRKRWRCTSRISGPASKGAPSTVRCKAGKGSVRFSVKISRATIARPPDEIAALATPSNPFTGTCVDDRAAAQLARPPAAPNDGVAIYAYGTVPTLVAEEVQGELVRRNAIKKLVDGLGARPRSYPNLSPLYLRKGVKQGITGTLCQAPGDGAVVELDGTVQGSAGTAAHELFHVHSRGIKVQPGYPWFDDVAAEWSVYKLGLLSEPTAFEAALQYPDTAADTNSPEEFRYGMWRFLQFLDDKGLVTGGDGSWPLIRTVVSGGPALTQTLDQVLQNLGTNLGAELGAFWGEHLKKTPSRPPQVVPVPANSQRVEVRGGETTHTFAAAPIHTKLLEFQLADDVRRVEFEFEPPPNGHFWGRTAPNASREFKRKETVSFCVGQANDDDLAWPGNLPVTFTSGALSGAPILGTITVRAQTGSEHCADVSNRACKVLRAAGAQAIFGLPLPNIGGFAGRAGTRGGRRFTSCAYKGFGGIGLLEIDRYRSGKELRAWLRRKAKSPGWRSLKQGDGAVILTAGGNNHTFVQVAVGRERLTVTASTNGSSTSAALRLADNAVDEIR